MNVFAMFFLIIETVFALAVFFTGLDLIKIKSFKRALTQYEKKPETHDVIQDWFFGWRFARERKTYFRFIKKFGDKKVTRFFNVSGAMLLVGSLIFVMSIVVQYRALTF